MTGNRATGPSYGDLLEICALNDGFPNQIDILLRDTRMSNEDPVQLQITRFRTSFVYWTRLCEGHPDIFCLLPWPRFFQDGPQCMALALKDLPPEPLLQSSALRHA